MPCASAASTQTLVVYEEVVQRILFLQRIESLLTTRIYEGDKADLSPNSRGAGKDVKLISKRVLIARWRAYSGFAGGWPRPILWNNRRRGAVRNFARVYLNRGDYFRSQKSHDRE